MASSDRPPPYSAISVPGAMHTLQVSDEGLHKFVIGIDFGTTATGVSCASTGGDHVKALRDVYGVRDWPSGGSDPDSSSKTPSRIAYGEDNGLVGNIWGYDVKPSHKSYTWMKLLLDPKQATKYDDPSLDMTEGEGVLSRPFGKSPVQLCADYLTEVVAYAYDSLARRYTPEILAASPIDFWFTVPAVWSDRAKADTLKAAQKAAKQAKLNLHPDSQIFLIREPEAAAIATLSVLTQNGSSQLVNPGDSILVCDCGGGTVDLITYGITSTTPKLEFKELVAGTGGKCGSTYIDREFVKWMQHQFGQAYTSLSWEKRGPSSRLMKDFETAKRDFGRSDDPSKVWEVLVGMKGVPDSEIYDADDMFVTIDTEDMKRVFEPVVSKITALLQSQLDLELHQTGKSTIGKVILVGGFGGSVYLNKVLSVWCKERNIVLLCPQHPESAIVRGAALSGLLNIQPSSRRSRGHYGIKCHEAFDPLRHRMEDMFIWNWTGEPRAAGNMHWELNKGEAVNPETNITFTYLRVLYEDALDEPEPVCIYYSDEDEAPLFVHQAGVRRLVTINCSMAGVDISQFRSKLYQGRTIRHVPFKYTISFGHRCGVLCFSVMVGGQEVGHTTVSFEGQNEQDYGRGVDDGGESPLCAVQ